jgi:putative hydrolase of the HAD superfamily
MKQHKYDQLFFDLDHTIWDFDSNSEATLLDLFHELKLNERATADFHHFHTTYHIIMRFIGIDSGKAISIGKN